MHVHTLYMFQIKINIAIVHTYFLKQTIVSLRFCLFTVLYEERYNDLEKYVCSVKGSDFGIEHFHPCAALTVNHVSIVVLCI